MKSVTIDELEGDCRSKLFLTYFQQMKKLRVDKGIICSSDKAILISKGYFNLINGYKLPFSSHIDANGGHVYEAGTSIENILEVKQFDDSLRVLLFSHIASIEEEVRNLTGYKFDEINNRGATEWFQIKAYDTNRNSNLKVAKLVSRLMGDIRYSKSSYLDHYQKNHHAVPTWILTKIIRLNTFVSFLEFSKTPRKGGSLSTLWYERFSWVPSFFTIAREFTLYSEGQKCVCA